MHPLTFKPRLYLLVMLLSTVMQACSAATPEGCTPVDAKSASGLVKIGIRDPGRYCLTEDLHARIEFADHPAEIAMIVIQSDNVVLDLQGHTLGRGRLFKNPGGYGIQIADGRTNIRIMNGTLRDFDYAIFRYRYPFKAELPIYDAQTNTYRFPISNIILENIIFENNKEKFQIRIP